METKRRIIPRTMPMEPAVPSDYALLLFSIDMEYNCLNCNIFTYGVYL